MAHAWAPLVGFLYVDRLGKGIRTAPRDALISLSSARARLAESFGVHRAFDTAGAVAGPIVASLILSQNPSGYRSVFVCSFFASCIGLGVLVFFVRNRRDDLAAASTAAPTPESGATTLDPTEEQVVEQPPRASIRTAVALLGDRRYAAVLAVAVVLALVVPGDALIYLTYSRQADLAAGFFPLLYAGASVGFLLLAVPLGRLADRIGRARVPRRRGHAVRRVRPARRRPRWARSPPADAAALRRLLRGHRRHPHRMASAVLLTAPAHHRPGHARHGRRASPT